MFNREFPLSAMKKILLALSMVALLVACDSGEKVKVDDSKKGFEVKDLNKNSLDCDQYVLMSTSRGDIKIKLYRETPLHRKNFINLVMNGYYDGQIFFRVVPGKLIQAGDYTSAHDRKFRKDMGVSDVDYTIPSEINPAKRVHKRGALAAASYNKGEYSSGAHFYIVSNKKVKEKELDAAEKEYTKELLNIKFKEIQKPHSKELARLKENKRDAEFKEKFNALYSEAKRQMKGKDFHYSKKQRNSYLKDGGMPELDPHYTVFGEVVEGMDVVDAISWESVYENRPKNDVVINKVTVVNAE